MPQTVQPEVGHVGFATRPLKFPCDHGPLRSGRRVFVPTTHGQEN
jgi:hypothetical protein